MTVYFTPAVQEAIYQQVPPEDRKWLFEAVAYVKRTRRGYPPDDPRWTDEALIEHVLYYVAVAKYIARDATLDDRNVLIRIRSALDNNPCPLRPVTAPEVPYIIIDEVDNDMPWDDIVDTLAMEESIETPDVPPEATPKAKPQTKKKASKKKASKKKVTRKKK
jgi:hypothetical protein